MQNSLRSQLAQIRHARIAPSAINAPPPKFNPPSLGVGLPLETGAGHAQRVNRGLQEERLERDAWKGVLEALRRIKDARDKSDSVDVQTAS